MDITISMLSQHAISMDCTLEILFSMVRTIANIRTVLIPSTHACTPQNKDYNALLILSTQEALIISGHGLMSVVHFLFGCLPTHSLFLVFLLFPTQQFIYRFPAVKILPAC